MKTLIALFVFGSVMLAQAPAPPKKSVATKAPTKAPAAAPAASPLMNPALLKARAPDVYRAKFTTTKGDFVIEVHRIWAPNGADRFYNLVRNRFFTNASFFRVIKGFMVQFGIPADPKIAAVWANANIKDDPVKQSNKEGMVTFAQTGAPNSRSTQVFINYGNNARLDPDNFSPFGQVTEGMDVVKTLYAEYGEGGDSGGRGPTQDNIQKQGKAYLDRSFPKLDSIKSASIVFPEAPAPAAKAPEKAPAK